MDLSILIAKILGVYLLASGIVLLFRGKSLTILLKDLFEHRALTWVAGFVLIVLGGLIVFSQAIDNKWVTIFGWLVLLKGVLYIIYPEFLSKISFKAVRPFTVVWGLISVILGIWMLLL